MFWDFLKSVFYRTKLFKECETATEPKDRHVNHPDSAAPAPDEIQKDTSQNNFKASQNFTGAQIIRQMDRRATPIIIN
jgi:hypothetical protein